MFRLPVFAVLALLPPPGAPQEPVSPDREGIEFFEKRIRPVLADRCFSCHSARAEKLKGGLRLDSREGLLKGGQSGPAIVPGDPEKSRLVRAIRHVDEDLRMPPKGKLPDAAIADFEAWVRRGAPDPRTGPAPGAGNAPPWSLQPVADPKPPEVAGGWARTPIDRFILAKLEEKGLKPAPEADRRTLLRRAAFDLTGLPPAPEEVEAFLADPAPDAFDKVVDRLLASPRYGERWGRHWLDVVRFGESHGYERNHLRPNAWPYRDYVIRALNEDKPYSDFLVEQLAGDVVARDDPAVEVATGFLVAGVHDDVKSPEVELTRTQRANDLDDIVSTTGAALLGITIGCARCHDHKFDPVPQADYYRLAAVFAGVQHDERAISTPAERERFEREGAVLSARLRALGHRQAEIDEAAREAALRARGVHPVLRPAVSAARNVERFAPVQARWVRFVVQATKDGLEPCLDELEVYAPGADENLASAGKASASSVRPGDPKHQIAHLNDGRAGNERSWISNEKGGGWAQVELAAAAEIGRVVWSRDSSDKPKYQDRLPSAYRVDVSEDGALWRTVASGGDRAPAPEKLEVTLTPAQKEARAAIDAEVAKVRARLETLKPASAYAGKFGAAEAVHLLARGDVMKPGEAVGPGALTRVPGLPGDLAIDASKGEGGRRLALARWIVDPKNPLTARVLVNRVWQHHFGRGLVATPSDFGANGSRPSHPELLDWLARDFVAGGWRIKRLHRQILLSAAWRQSGRPDPRGMEVDAGNVFLWRMPLRRLEAEAIRDSILAVSGKLDLRMGGPGFRLYDYKINNIAFYEPLTEQGPETWRRAVYQQAARAYREELMVGFDAPENAQRSPRRDVTTTPLQALTLLNSEFVVRQAGFMAARARAGAGSPVERAFRLAFGRGPEPGEREAAEALAARHGLAALCRALINANEFLYY